MKTLLAAAVSILLCTACSSSDDDGSDPAGNSGSGGPIATTDDGAEPAAPVGAGGGTTDDGTAPATPAGAADEALALDVRANDLVEALAGYGSERAEPRVREFAARALDSALGSRPLQDAAFTVDDRGTSIDVPTSRMQYDCALGGAMITEQSVYRVREDSYSREVKAGGYDFDQCQLADDTMANGKLVLALDATFASRGTLRSRVRTWTGFSMRAPAGGLQIDGNTSYFQRQSADEQESRSVDLVRLIETDGDGATLSSVQDASLTLMRSTRAGNGLQDYSLELSGSVLDNGTDGRRVTVSTVTPLDRSHTSVADLQNDARPFSGELSLRDEAGSSLTVTARETAEPELSVDLDFTGSDGSSRTSQSAGFVDLPARAASDDTELEF